MTSQNMILQRRLVLLATLAVVISSFRHLATSFCQLEPQAGSGVALFSATCTTALFTAVAVDVSVIVLVRLTLGGREIGGKIGAILMALSIVTILSVLGNLSAGLTTTVAHDGGGTGALFTLDDLRQLDALSIGRVAVFFGLLPILVLLLTFAGARAAQNEREALQRPSEPRIAPDPAGTRVEAPEPLLAPPAPLRPRLERLREPARIRRALPDVPAGDTYTEDPQRMTLRGTTTKQEQLAIARRVYASGGGAEAIAQEAGVSLSTGYRLWRRVKSEADASGGDLPDGRML